MTHEAYRDRAQFRDGPAGGMMEVVMLGMARGAIDAFIRISSERRSRRSFANRAQMVGKEQLHQVRLAHADAILRAAIEARRMRSRDQESDAAFACGGETAAHLIDAS